MWYPDLIVSVLEFLPIPSLLEARLVNKTWAQLGRYGHLWKDIDYKIIPKLLPILINPKAFRPNLRYNSREDPDVFITACQLLPSGMKELYLTETSSLEKVLDTLKQRSYGLEKFHLSFTNQQKLIDLSPNLVRIVNLNQRTLRSITIPSLFSQRTGFLVLQVMLESEELAQEQEEVGTPRARMH